MAEPQPMPSVSCSAAGDRTELLLTLLRKALAHDLSNQLVTTQGLLRLLELEEGARLSADGQDYLRRLVAGSARAQALVRNLVELIRLTLVREPAEAVNLADVVQEAAAEVNQLLLGRQIEYHFPEVLPVLTVPRGALRLALNHLLHNAVEAAEVGASVAVQVTVRTTPSGQEIAITDASRSLTEEQQRQLNAFFAGQAAEIPGGNFGLALARQAVASWDGRLRVEIAPDRRIVFLIRVPAGMPLAGP